MCICIKMVILKHGRLLSTHYATCTIPSQFSNERIWKTTFYNTLATRLFSTYNHENGRNFVIEQERKVRNLANGHHNRCNSGRNRFYRNPNHCQIANSSSCSGYSEFVTKSENIETSFSSKKNADLDKRILHFLSSSVAGTFGIFSETLKCSLPTRELSDHRYLQTKNSHRLQSCSMRRTFHSYTTARPTCILPPQKMSKDSKVIRCASTTTSSNWQLCSSDQLWRGILSDTSASTNHILSPQKVSNDPKVIPCVSTRTASNWQPRSSDQLWRAFHSYTSASTNRIVSPDSALNNPAGIRFASTTTTRDKLRAKIRSNLPDLKEEELEEQFVRGSGPGGQATNKTSNCVVLKHVPTGIVVKCHQTRSVTENQKIARLLMKERLDQHLHGDKSVIAQHQQAMHKKREEKKRKTRLKLEKLKALRSSEDDNEEDSSDCNQVTNDKDS